MKRKITERRRLYFIWQAMKSRCYNSADPAFKNYGARGITVCRRWMSFDNFLADIGQRPTGMMVDRTDNNKGYSQSNFRWATRKEQNSNRRNCIYVEFNGARMTLKEACRQSGLTYRPVHKRITMRGWSVARALSTPIGIGNTHGTR